MKIQTWEWKKKNVAAIDSVIHLVSKKIKGSGEVLFVAPDRNYPDEGRQDLQEYTSNPFIPKLGKCRSMDLAAERIADLGSTVSLDYYDRRPFEFNGKIKNVKIELK